MTALQAPPHSTSRRSLCLAATGTALLSALPAATRAADAYPANTYPAKPIRLIVPFPAGGGADALARTMMGRVAADLGQPIVIDIVGGAGGNVGAQAAARAANDGYTLLYGTNGTHAINHALYKNAGFDPLKDFEPISRLTTIAALLVVRPGLPVASMAELLKLLKTNPGKYTVASAGNGTTSHLCAEMLKVEAGLAVVHIPYRGGGAALTDLLGGQVDFIIDLIPSVGPQVKSGRLRALAASTAKRVVSFPDIPTIAESGVKGFDVSAWDAVFAPAGTPRPVVERVNQAIQKALAESELRTRLQERGSDVAPTSPEGLRAFVTSEMPRWAAVVQRSRATVD